MQAARVIGGAGTGKTSMMIGIMEKALDRPEVAGNPFALGFSSFTRAARAEASGRAAAAWNVPQGDLERAGWFRTAHSVAYRVLGLSKGEVLGGGKEDDKWVSEALGSDVQASFDEDEGGVAVYTGDPVAAASLNYWSVARSRVVPLRQVVEADQNPEAPAASEVIKRIEAYEAAKRLDARIDFTDMLCRFAGVSNSPADGPEFVTPEGMVPDSVVGWIFDEAQDASRLLDLACRRLVTGESCKWAWLVGDPYQVLYSWAGASSEYFMAWDVGTNQKIMPKSYRCAAPILALGERCLQRLGDDYWDRGIAPADHAGEVIESDNFEDDLADIDPRQETLVIARTNRNVGKIAAILDDVGVPFRRVKAKQGAYNRDLGMAGLWKLQHGQPATAEEWGNAIDILPSKTTDGRVWLERGSKANWSRGLKDRFDLLFPEYLPEVGATEHLRAAIASGQWSGLPDGGTKWYAAAKRYGIEVVAEPKVRIGTIHCSPPDEPVLTTDGLVPIGSLDNERHRLCSATVCGGLMTTWGGRGPRGKVSTGYGFVSASRPYSGDLITIRTERSQTRVTPCHRLVVRWAECFFDKWLVYLMRLGDWWRVGISKTASIPYKPGGIGGRLATEKADACWILGIHDTERSARVAEATIQARYGIPGLCFRKSSISLGSAFRTEDLESIHTQCAEAVSARIPTLMLDFGLLQDEPIRRRDRGAVFGKAFEIVAANFIPRYMKMPVVSECFTSFSERKKVDWLQATAWRERYDGPVHSLEVLPHHYYVSGNAVVHNSVKGQEADNVIVLTSQGQRVSQSELDDPARFAEERRIEYVAVTRARRKLVVAHDPREKYRMEFPL